MATLPRAAPSPAAPAAARPLLLRAAPPLLLAGRAAAARRLRARDPSSLAAARRNWAVPTRAVLGGVARREKPAAPQKPTQEVRVSAPITRLGYWSRDSRRDSWDGGRG
jgi:glutamate synthase (ferredoxin)